MDTNMYHLMLCDKREKFPLRPIDNFLIIFIVWYGNGFQFLVFSIPSLFNSNWNWFDRNGSSFEQMIMSRRCGALMLQDMMRWRSWCIFSPYICNRRIRTKRPITDLGIWWQKFIWKVCFSMYWDSTYIPPPPPCSATQLSHSSHLDGLPDMTRVHTCSSLIDLEYKYK